MKTALFSVLFVALCTSGQAFVLPQEASVHGGSSSLAMAPRFDPSEQRWYPSTEEESAEAGYPPIRSLLRHGPSAFLVRTTQPDKYDQAVLKFMATDQADRWTAQGNMDRYFENAQDWAFERLEAERKGIKLDYVTLNKKNVFLSSIWAGIVFWFLTKLVESSTQVYS